MSTTDARALAPVTPDWLTIREAHEKLEALHNVQIAYVTVQKACLRYRHRLEGRQFDDQPPDPEAAKREDPRPGPRELRCIWKEMGGGATGRFGRRLMYLVDPSEENLAHFELRGLDAENAPGRKVGGPFSHKAERTYGGRPAKTSQPLRGKRKPAKTSKRAPAATHARPSATAAASSAAS